jgi:hypothetical protein
MRWLCLIYSMVFLVLQPGKAAAGGAQYRTVASTEYGRAVVGQRVDAQTVRAALQLTLKDMEQYFGSAPKVRSAYEDARDPRSGGATFLIKARGVPVKGLVTCKVGPQATNIAVIYIRADAPAAEWRRLTQSPQPEAATASQAGGRHPGPAKVPLHRYAFADGTGSIGLADGWHTNVQSAMQGIPIKGPDGAEIMVAGFLSVLTPNSPLARGGQSLVAPFGAPIAVMQALAPQLSRMSVSNGGPAKSFDSFTLVKHQKPGPPNGAESVITFGVTEQSRAGTRHFKVMASVGVSPTSQTSYMMFITQARAPDATYDRDLPVMLEIIQSLKTNDGVIQQRSNQAVAAQTQWFNAQQAAHRQQVAAYDAHNQQYWDSQKANQQRNNDWERQQNTQARGHDDFDELIRGYRTVEDTQTGVKHSVDLGNVDKIVDDLNERDPGRYRQIPLRDEADPLPRR